MSSIAAMLVLLGVRCCRWCTNSWGWQQIPIGEPFFKTTFTWPMAPFALLLEQADQCAGAVTTA
ncbi:hypothetical protein ACNKHK_14515 [Shigella flexneri]